MNYPDPNVLIAAESSAAEHLTPDQIDDHLIGDLAPAPAAHLAVCSLCAERLAAAASPLEGFQQVSTAWSERRSATLPRPTPPPPRPLWQRHTAWATASLTLAFGFAFFNATRQLSLQNTQPTPAATRTSALPQSAFAADLPVIPVASSTASAPESSQISADNHLLRAIDNSLDSSTDSPAALGLAPSASPRSGPPTSLQD